VLAHRDIQAHNLAVAPGSGALLGIFGFDDAGVAHRLEDFKYLPSFGPAFTAVAVDAYGGAGGSAPSVEEVGHFRGEATASGGVT
jgi:aminoglycoside phosphotransferase (APT) family kinase protein